MKLWGGRFNKETNKLVDDFNSSISFDSRFYEEDIKGSIAHSTMLGNEGIISKSEADKIVCELENILSDIEDGKVEFSLDNEDIHMNIESILTQRIGDTGKRLHTARSRNDQVALDMKMYCKKEVKEIKILLVELLKSLCKKAEENKETVMPGFTHLQHAQPITFAHHVMAYAQMFKRDITRLNDCYERMNEMPLGSCALAGTTHPINRQFVSDALGFNCPTENSLDGVSDRDYVIEMLSAISVIMMHLSRFSEEIILWCSWEYHYIELDDAFSTGSSIMPQKKNPDICELIRGKTGRVYGSLVSMLTVMKSLPLAYNKDMQEDKEMTFDAIDTVKLCIKTFIPMFDTMRICSDNMRKSASHGFINATDCADYLTKKDVPFRDAYTIVGKIVNYCIENNKTIETMTLEELKAMSPMFDLDVYKAVDLDTCVNERKSFGGPAKEMTQIAIENTLKFIKQEEE
ncbi:MAG: argininosuccinate lyase [Oscillospiraceae bacterium]